MYFVLLAAAIAILAGVVAVAMGRGGEISRSRRDQPDHPPRVRSAADVARLQLPVGLLGYKVDVTDQALNAAARLIADQEAEIERLREQVWRLRPQPSQETRTAWQASGAQADAAVGDGSSEADDKVPSPDPVGGEPWLKP
ncbi:MAG: hypothetical protein LBV34_26470 [Nocardiopsaceae bacterium]|nr:hypothetical protein [Nocardiopsaceae bacterium]